MTSDSPRPFVLCAARSVVCLIVVWIVGLSLWEVQFVSFIIFLSSVGRSRVLAEISITPSIGNFGFGCAHTKLVKYLCP